MKSRLAPCFALATAATLSFSHPAKAFDYFEHRWIGDVACNILKSTEGLESLQCSLDLHSKDSRDYITFGDLVAMAGDHFGSLEDLSAALADWANSCKTPSEACDETAIHQIIVTRNDQAGGVRNWAAALHDDDIAACQPLTNWLDSENLDSTAGTSTQGARACLSALVANVKGHWGVTRVREVRGQCYEPWAYEAGSFAATPSYPLLAATDANHFGRRAEREWAGLIAKAPAWSGAHSTLMDPAVVARAFAFHFFTDRYASGHMRTDPALWGPREAVRRHDFDDTNGLLVALPLMTSVYPSLTDSDRSPKQSEFTWRAYGDRCLLGGPARVHRAITTLMTLQALAEAFGVGDRVPGREFVLRASPPTGDRKEDMEAALSIWFPRVDTVYNEQIPPAPGFLTGEFGPTIGAVFMKARTPGFLAGGSFMLASTSITGLGLGVESVQGSNGYADFGGFFQLDATFVSADALFLRNSVHLMPLCVRLYLVAGRLSPTQSFQSGFRGEYQLRFTPPGDWVASIAAGATVIAGAPNLGFTTTAFIGREL